MATQCEPFYVCGSAVIITVQDCRTECGKRSEGKTPKNDFTFSDCTISMLCSSEIRRYVYGIIYADGIIEFEIEYTRDGVGQRLVNFKYTVILPISGCDVCPSEAPRSGVKSKSTMK